ncbi:unnamed protein product [Urochloa humidicola]
MAAKLFLLALLISFLLVAPRAATTAYRLFLTTMTRSEKAAINFTRVAHKSHQHPSMLAARIDASSVSEQTPLQRNGGGGEYEMTFSVGTPPQELSAHRVQNKLLIFFF